MEVIHELPRNSKWIKKIRFSKPTHKIMKKQILFLLSSLLFLAGNLYSQQQQPFGDEIHEFRKVDSQQVAKDIILFTGSSSIRMWQNLQESFPGYKVLNRGFGGSTLADLDRYLTDIVFPYQ